MRCCGRGCRTSWSSGGRRSRSAVMLRREFPDDPEMRVSHETICQSIYVQGRGALRRELAVCLRTGRALRKPRRGKGSGAAGSRTWCMISERPAEAADRAVPGHWEGDLIVGKDNKSVIGTLVERSTRFVLLLHLPHGHDAAGVAQAMTAAMGAMPAPAAPVADLGPGPGDGRARPGHPGHRPAGVLLRPALAMAARQQREHQRAAAPVLPQGAPTCPCTAASAWNRSPPSSTPGPARPWDGRPPRKPWMSSWPAPQPDRLPRGQRAKSHSGGG